MSARLRAMSDDELGDALAGLDLDWPPTPDLAASVTAAARRPAPRAVRLPLPRSRKILLIAAAIVVLLAGAAVAAKIVFDIGAVVLRVTPDPRTNPSPTATIPFGEPITRAEAARLLGSELALPSSLGPPDRLWADELLTETDEVVRVTAAWEPGPGLPAIDGSRFGAVLMRFEGDTDQAFKDVFESTDDLETATVNGQDAYWTTGPHVIQLLTSEGIVHARVEGNVLLWRDGVYTMRLETALPKAQAVRIAETAGTPSTPAV
jgi:hypothetical protein